MSKHKDDKTLSLSMILSSSSLSDPFLISTIDLSCRHLCKFVPESLILLQNVHNINLAGNQRLFSDKYTTNDSIRKIFLDLSHLVSLRELNLSSNNLSTFPENLSQNAFSSLEILNLS